MVRRRTAIALALAWSVATSLAGTTPAAAESVPYLSGGVGSDERERLEQRAAGYTVLVELADPSGKLEGGGRIAIRDAAGKAVLETNMDGPQLAFAFALAIAGRASAADIVTPPLSTGEGSTSATPAAAVNW